MDVCSSDCCYYSCFFVELAIATATDTITFNHSIKGSETTILSGGVFEMGFFSPENSTNRYLGIGYSFSHHVVIWVANIYKPHRDCCDGILKISMDDNLLLSDAKGQVLWSSSNNTTTSETTMASNNSSTVFLSKVLLLITKYAREKTMSASGKGNSNLADVILKLGLFESYHFNEFATTTATDTFTFNHSIKGSETIISNSSVFELGFFSPVNSTNRYLGIWYSFSPNVVVWVANRDKPLRDNSNGVLKISMDGDLVLSDARGQVLWSSSNSTTSSGTTMVSNNSSTSAQLLDTGNLVLKDYQGTTIWESFLHPCDTLLPKMRLFANSKQQSKVQLTSWKSISDPSIGSFSGSLESQEVPEGFIWKGDRPYWRTGPWNGQHFLGVVELKIGYLEYGLMVVDNKEGNVYATLDYGHIYTFSRFVLNLQGQLSLSYWSSENKKWEFLRSVPNFCGVYGTCGPFGSCSSLSSAECRCLRGFKPINIKEWNRGNWTSGCVRRTPLQCDKLNKSTISNTSAYDTGKDDAFMKLKAMKVPDFMILVSAPQDNCQDQCLKNCSCTAYAFDIAIGCMLWSGNLIDLQQLPNGNGTDLYIRLDNSEFSERKQLAKIITIAVIIGTFTIATGAYFLYMGNYKQRVRKRKSKEMHSPGFKGIESLKFPGEVLKQQELRLFNFEKLAVATNNFRSDTILGQGGFGQVYKGKLEDGLVIAIKRLSRASGQGLIEFTNEVVVISELQHRNLVKLLGYCVDGEEKMLIYEYLPNKSLDAFVFDPLKKKLLDWRRRFNIIEGIGRGLLYLHRDSRLKIIHRDLKPSNILLDEELNPKISDFGMAKIFQGNENHANTRRVVGTYGYMSPEYAFEGLFSEKSDVFSFGVLLLEIVSGRRSSSFHQDEESSSLLKFAWKLWNENNIIALTDPALSSCYQDDENEIMRCLQVGLLCVQESARSRPSMPSVVSMLNSEIIDLPTPNKPAYTERHIASYTDSSSQLNRGKCSINNASLTTIDGR
ncbi:hypothetical protein FNV43_RR24938 [Rhamnella rubrinervis]|uniref:Receptor-like serine/threonine-protein kinase n=1 Tax=Rhamnella rubrinervis TaxID=2594499 RepID=A0A8K0DMP6_9ROSA|nr:hypothetical protein FNV43_RR24938 [Rhamnella rubrinervis]